MVGVFHGLKPPENALRKSAPDGVLNIPVPQIALYQPRVCPLVGQSKAARMAQHVRVSLNGQGGGESRKQDVKPFLREMTIVRKRVREALSAHDVHGNAVRKAIFLIGACPVQCQSIQK